MALFDVILAATLNDLAELYKEEGRYADAEPLYKRALATWTKALGSEPPDAVQSLNNLADLYSAEGRHADAEPLYKRAPASTPERRGVPSVPRCVLSSSERIRLC